MAIGRRIKQITGAVTLLVTLATGIFNLITAEIQYRTAVIQLQVPKPQPPKQRHKRGSGHAKSLPLSVARHTARPGGS